MAATLVVHSLYTKIQNKSFFSSLNMLRKCIATHQFSALVPTFPDRGYHVVSVTDPYGRNLNFLDRSSYFFFQVAPQLYSRG
jgi:hypothetical protein